ncbi:MAG: DNA translocase FtsK [Dehalococcoidia bacterium]|nr:DNA translocase FtsK [Dehalococcoidia bacterium]
MAKASMRSRPGAGRSASLAPRRAAGKSLPRRRAAGRAHRGPSLFSTLRSLLLRWEALGVALVVTAMVAIPWLVPVATGLSEARDGLVETLGVGVFLLIVLLGLFGWLIIRHAFIDAFYVYWRRWLVSLFCAGFGMGFLGLFRPDWRLGGTTLSDVTAGGNWGHALVTSPPGILGWWSLALAAAAVIWPRGSLLLARQSPRLAVVVWRWRLPQRTYHLTLRLGEAVFPTKTEPEPSKPVSMETLMWARTASPPVEDATASEAATVAVATPEAPVEQKVAEPWQPALPMNVEGSDEDTPAASPGSGRWEMPPIETLMPAGTEAAERPDNAARSRLIVDTLGSFGVDAEVVQINEGPTVTQFGVEPGWEIKTRTVQERDSAGRPVFDRNGRPKIKTEEVSRTRVRVSQITSLSNDLALALATPSLRIEAPVPGMPVVGIEVPNVTTSLVTLRSVIESPAFQRLAGRSKLALALGKSVSGEPVVADLAKMPHLLIAGATGSGKSVCINSVITCLLMQSSPDDVRLVMIDPKRVELAAFAPIPHLAFSSIVIDIDKVVGTLQAVIHEMEGRYRRFASLAVRNIEAYNRHPKAHVKLPYWVVIIDELADLMMAAPYEVERQVCRLAQLARATGIHLVIATQRPSVDVVTGLIKANFPTRIAFAVSSQTDSRVILDQGGAESLLGNGDMLFHPLGHSRLLRVQGAFMSPQELKQITEHWKRQAAPEFREDLLENPAVQETGAPQGGGGDDLLADAIRTVVGTGAASVALLQRRLRVGYARAGRLVDVMEQMGIISGYDGSKARGVLIGEEDLPATLASLDGDGAEAPSPDALPSPVLEAAPDDALVVDN